MKTQEEEERDNFAILMKAAGNDPKALAAVVKEMLLADKTIKAPTKQVDEKDEEMVNAARDILGLNKKKKF